MTNLSDEEVAYKYIPCQHIKSLLEDKYLYFCRIAKWPDMMEQYLDGIAHPDQATKRFGSCWTLHKGIVRVVESNSPKALDDVRRNGVDSMWRTYCPQGGIRIETSLGRIRKALKAYCEKSNAILV